MRETDMRNFNEKIIEEFRANGGKVGMFADYPMVVLHTIGAKSGKPHLVPLVLTINEADEWILFAGYVNSAAPRRIPVFRIDRL